jgi:hypothetical protein
MAAQSSKDGTKMNAKSNATSGSTQHLKSVVEQSISVLSEARGSNPIPALLRRRSLPIHIDAANLKNIAVDNAAKALAALWNISAPRRAHGQGRAMEFSRQTS